MGPDPNPRIGSGSFQNPTGRVGSGREIIRLSRIGSDHYFPVWSDLTREDWPDP